jgi:hypothetical protein
MAASKTFSLTTTGTSMPVGGAVTEALPSDTAATAVQVTGSLVLSTSFQQITVPAGCTYVILTMAAGNAISITIAGGNTDTGINMGSGWTWCKLGCLGGTATLWVKAASSTPTIYYEFN